MSVRRDGIDLSHWQNNLTIDFAKAKAAGVLFVTHKATEGTTYVDDGYARRRGQVKAAGLQFGAYHFARPGASSGTAQAQYFLAHADPQPGDLWPMLDLEVSDGRSKAELTAWARDFVATVKARTGGVFVYTQFDLNDNFGCPLWSPRYSDAMYLPAQTKPWADGGYSIWQFSDGVYPHNSPLNYTPGVGHVDANYLNTAHPLAMLASFTIAGTTPPVVTSSTPRLDAARKAGLDLRASTGPQRHAAGVAILKIWRQLTGKKST